MKRPVTQVVVALACAVGILPLPSRAFAMGRGRETLRSFQGQIHNYSNVPLSAIRLRASWSCYKSSFLIGQVYCGGGARDVSLSSDGSFTFPAMVLSGGGDYTVGLDLAVAPGPGVGQEIYDERDFIFSDLSKVSEDLRNISLYELQAQKLRFDLRSGAPSEDWIAAEGRETETRAYFQFHGDLDPVPGELAYQNDSVFAVANADQGNADELAPKVFFVAGNLGPTPLVYVHLAVANEAIQASELVSSDYATVFKGTLPSDVLTFKIDDTGFPQFDRTVDGLWEGDLEFPTQGAFVPIDAELNCENGTIVGTATLGESYQGTPYSEGYPIYKAAVSGTCHGEKAEIRFDAPIPGTLAITPYELSIAAVKFSSLGQQKTALKDIGQHDPDEATLTLINAQSAQKVGSAQLYSFKH